MNGGGTEKMKEKEKEEKKEKIPHMCESIGHRPLRVRCPALSLNLTDKLLQHSRARVPLTIWRFCDYLLFWAFWAYSSCPDALVSFSSTVPAHLHATRVAVYQALF